MPVIKNKEAIYELRFWKPYQNTAFKPLYDPGQLAQKLGVSAQAVSKWESGTNMPDIMMLPDLSVIFGVTIDELFAMTDEHRMERIENMLYDVRFLSNDEFQQHEKYLKDLQGKPEYSAQAGLLLAMLYNTRG